MPMVNSQPPAHGLFLIIDALDQRFAGDIVDIRHFRRLVVDVVAAA